MKFVKILEKNIKDNQIVLAVWEYNNKIWAEQFKYNKGTLYSYDGFSGDFTNVSDFTNLDVKFNYYLIEKEIF